MGADFLAARVARIKPSPTIAVSTRAQELRAAGRDVINLGAGEPDFDTPPHIKEAAKAAIDEGQTKYTAVGGTPALKDAICEKLRRENNLSFSPAQVCASVGAKHSILNLMLALLDDGDEAVVPAPYWVSYPDMALFCGATPIAVAAGADSGYKISATDLAANLSAKTKLVILNSPSNPTGALYSESELRALGEALRAYPRAWIVSDDIYEHIRYDDRPFANLANACPDLAPRVLVVNGVSKAYAMTGWRIGYAAGDERIIKAATKIQSQGTSNPSSISQAAAVAALTGGIDCVAPMLAAFARRRRLVVDGLNAVAGLRCPPVEGAFYAFADAAEAVARLADNGKITRADDVALCEYLLDEAGVAVVPGSAFGCENAFRVSFAASDEALKKALERINAAFM